MTDAAMWREKAALLRERAAEATDAKKQRELEMLAEDCEEMAASLEAAMKPRERPEEGWDGQGAVSKWW